MAVKSALKTQGSIQITTMKTLLPILLLVVTAFTAVFAKGGPAINDKCPVDGKAVRIIYRVFTEMGNVAFCCVECMETYQKDPARYPVTPKKPGS
jgi:hypothetical protein